MVRPGGGGMGGEGLPGETDVSDEIGGWAGASQARVGQGQDGHSGSWDSRRGAHVAQDRRSEALWPGQGAPGVGWGPGRWVTGQQRLGQIQEASESMQEHAG